MHSVLNSYEMKQCKVKRTRFRTQWKQWKQLAARMEILAKMNRIGKSSYKPKKAHKAVVASCCLFHGVFVYIYIYYIVLLYICVTICTIRICIVIVLYLYLYCIVFSLVIDPPGEDAEDAEAKDSNREVAEEAHCEASTCQLQCECTK